MKIVSVGPDKISEYDLKELPQLERQCSYVSVDAVTELYQEVKSDCMLNTKLIVQIKVKEIKENKNGT